MSDHQIVLLFIKAPVRGRVKSRLAGAIGEEAALDLYRSFILDTIDMLERTGCTFRIFCHPPEAVADVSQWLRASPVVPQEGDDLGARMENAFRRVFSEGWSQAVLIGSDIPDLPEGVIPEAFTLIMKHKVVLGPAADGGYYLIGFAREAFLPAPFSGISWSTPDVFARTRDVLQAAGLRVPLLREWRDVDSFDDLQALAARSVHSPFRSSRTMTYLAQNRSLLARGRSH
jgi:hypothetical protein